MTLADLLTPPSPRHPAVILPDDERTVTYAELAQQVAAVAEQLGATGLSPGSTVALVLPNGLESIVAFLAVSSCRLVAAPLNPAYKVEEFHFSLEDMGAAAVIAPPGDQAVRSAARGLGLPVWTARRSADGAVRLDDLPTGRGTSSERPRPDDVALFLHTSGTTSRPKGVPLTHANLMASVRNIVTHYRLTPSDVSLVVMPLFHVHGLIGVTLSSLRAGGTLVVPPRFSASGFWPAVRRWRVSWYSAAPTIHQILLQRADADDAPHRSGFRFIRSCSAALAPATLVQLESRFGAPVLEAYAMTEAAHQMCANPLPPGVRKPGSVGPGSYVEVAIMDDGGDLLPVGTPGEVVVRGPNVMAGYRNNPEANRTAFTRGWFRTGDRGVLDADGYLTLIGRIKELINRG
ncbi:MAG: AMP-binding protein, partial [Gemmataceae bacterium]|nr:AMP-binding protein [Gemmataceae bacterium]MDW8264602.1 AMP-binding protein [Gemmataceae bacterium]